MKGNLTDETTVRPSIRPQLGVNESLLSQSTGFVVFEDYFAGIRAKRRFEALSPKPPSTSNVPNMWKMDYLEHPAIRKMAVEEACQANLVIISISGDEELPQGMRTWLKDWSNDISRCGAEILAIVEIADAIVDTLEEEAEAAGLSDLRREAEWSEVPFSFELACPITSYFPWLNDDQA